MERPDIVKVAGKLPLHVAVIKSDTLSEAVATCQLWKWPNSITPLPYAIASFDKSNPLNLVDPYPRALGISRQPLHSAFGFRWDDLNLIKAFTRRWPAALNCANVHRELPLHIAARYGSTECVRFLAGQSPQAMTHGDENGNLPLHLALLSLRLWDADKIQSIEFLASQCPDALTTANRWGLRPYEIALQRHWDCVLDDLVPAGAQSLLHIALDYEETQLFTILRLLKRFPERLKE